MKLLFKLVFFIALTGPTLHLHGLDTIITLFVQKYPYFKDGSAHLAGSTATFNAQKYSKKLRQPDYLYKKITNRHLRHEIPGVMCLYGGRVALSSPRGQITFPRIQQSNDMHILISKGIKPAYIVSPGTVHNWMLDNNHPAEMYLMKLKHDESTLLYYYETTKVGTPADQNIPKNCIIFISEPENMYIPLGATIVDYSPNIILPTIYIKRDFCFVYNSLYSLAVKQYFESGNSSVKQDGATIAQIQQLN